jgi:hypothetical protein
MYGKADGAIEVDGWLLHRSPTECVNVDYTSME